MAACQNKNTIFTDCRCEVHHEDETDDHTASANYLRLDKHNARNGKQCPKGGTQECFHDCYFDPVDAGTVVQPNGALGADVCASTKDIGIECWGELLWVMTNITFSFSKPLHKCTLLDCLYIIYSKRVPKSNGIV